MTRILTTVPILWLAWAAQQGNEHYQRGRQALDRAAWQEAIAAFEQVSEDDDLRDAALYWQAYAHRKAGNTERSLELVSELARQFPDSRWTNDGRALAVEIRGTTSSEDDELKLMALNGLLHMDEAQAIPILEEFLAGAHSPRLKERALFVLAQSGSERAYEILATVARNGGEPELQRKAIRYLGVHESDRSLQLLSELYGSLSDVESRAAVLQSLMIAGEKDRLLRAAREESNEDLRGRAIHLLGTMNAAEELWALYGGESSEEIKGRILHALFIAGQHDRLLEVARNTNESVELRKRAIHNLGVSGEGARPALLQIYSAEPNQELKEQTLHALFIQDAATELIQIARAETDPELKKRAVHWISIMGSPEAKDFLMELLRK